MRFIYDGSETAKQFQKNLAGLKQRFSQAVTAATNMAASMILDQVEAEVSKANFPGSWTENLGVQVDGSLGNMRVSLTGGNSALAMFEEGGVIQGSPLLWIPISGTDAVHIRARDYGGLFSARYPRKYGRPLLFAISDKLPRYFGIEEVTMPKLLHINEIVESVMGHYREIFDSQFQGGAP